MQELYKEATDLYCGRQGAVNRAKAYELFLKAAREGVAEAQFMVGFINEKGADVEQDIPSAIEWYCQSYQNGYIVGAYEAARLHYETNNYEKAIILFREAEGAGVHKAKLFIGCAYENGYGVQQDPDKAFEYYRAASTKGVKEAFHFIANCYRCGIGVSRDLSEMQRYLEKGCELGDATACGLLAERYYNGEISSDDRHAVSLKYYLRAADLGLPIAQEWCGEAYALGIGVKKDLAKALPFLEAATQQGMPRAKYLIAHLTVTGRMIPDSPYDPFELCFDAAQSGDPDAQCLLGLMYQRGDYTTQNEDQAITWLRRAAESGQKRAISELEK